MDITALTVGTSIRVSDVALPAGVELDVDPETAVVTGVPPRVQTRAEEAAEEEAAAETAAAAAAEASEAEEAAGQGGAPDQES